MSSGCDDNVLLRYRLKLLSEKEEADLRQHLVDCDSCTAYLAALPVDPAATVDEDMNDVIIGPNLPEQRFFVVEPHPQCTDLSEKKLTDGQDRSMTLLVMKLMYIADDIAPDESGIRCIEFTKMTRLPNNTYIEPLCVFFTMSEDGQTALLLDVQQVEGDGLVHIARGDMFETFRDELIKAISERKRG